MEDVTVVSSGDGAEPRRKAPALRQPSESGSPSDWGEKVAQAKEAREVGRRLREGKPVTFTTRRAPWRA